jgi:hypothetical protein
VGASRSVHDKLRWSGVSVFDVIDVIDIVVGINFDVVKPKLHPRSAGLKQTIAFADPTTLGAACWATSAVSLAPH